MVAVTAARPCIQTVRKCPAGGVIGTQLQRLHGGIAPDRGFRADHSAGMYAHELRNVAVFPFADLTVPALFAEFLDLTAPADDNRIVTVDLIADHRDDPAVFCGKGVLTEDINTTEQIICVFVDHLLVKGTADGLVIRIMVAPAEEQNGLLG